MAFRLLDNMGFDPKEIAVMITAIGNHDDGTGILVNAVAAALILADKLNAHLSRVGNQDIHFILTEQENYGK